MGERMTLRTGFVNYRTRAALSHSVKWDARVDPAGLSYPPPPPTRSRIDPGARGIDNRGARIPRCRGPSETL